MLWGVLTGFVVYAIIGGFLFLSHLGRRPDERLSPLRFAVTLVVASLLPVLVVLGLPIGFPAFDAPVPGVGMLFVLLVFSSLVGFFFGSIGLVLYSVMCGLPEGRTSA